MLEYLVDFDSDSYSTKVIKIWKSDSQQIFKKQNIDIMKISNKYDDKNSLVNFYDEKNSSTIWNFHDLLKINCSINQNNNEDDDNDQKKFSEIQ